MRDIYYVFICASTNKTEILHNNEIKTVDGIDVLTHVNLSKKSLVFINYLYYIKQRYPGGTAKGEEYTKYGQTETVAYEYGNTLFRNIACFLSGQSEALLHDMFPDVPITVAMREFIFAFDKNPEKVEYTLGYMVKKMFYADIKDALWEEKKKHKAYYYDLDTYDDMMVANKSGALSDVHIYAEDVLCYDKRSAYASVMVNDDKFPIGKERKIEFDDPEYAKHMIMRYVKNGTYCKIVLDYVVDGFEVFYEKEVGKTGIEYDNFLDLIEDDRFDEFFSKITNGRLYHCLKTGYLADIFRKSIIDAYNKKESTTGVTKFFGKTKINILYGKGIQKYNFADKYEMQKHYKGRGENYLQPEQSLHCQAVLLHEIHNAIRNNIAVYWDTDGIKVKNTPEARKYFEEQNRIIMQKNKAAGYDSIIGTWKLEAEASRIITFGCKHYIIETADGSYDMTWSGMHKKDQKRVLSMLGDDKIQTAATKGLPEIIRVITLDGNRIKQLVKINHIRFEGDYEWQKRKQKQSQDTLKSNRCSKSIRQQDTTSSSAAEEPEKLIRCSKNASVTQSTEKEFLRMYADTKNLSKKPILMILSGRTITGLMDTRVVSGTELFTIDQDFIWNDGERTTTELMKKKQETQILSVVRGR